VCRHHTIGQQPGLGPLDGLFQDPFEGGEILRLLEDCHPRVGAVEDVIDQSSVRCSFRSSHACDLNPRLPTRQAVGGQHPFSSTKRFLTPFPASPRRLAGNRQPPRKRGGTGGSSSLRSAWLAFWECRVDRNDRKAIENRAIDTRSRKAKERAWLTIPNYPDTMDLVDATFSSRLEPMGRRSRRSSPRKLTRLV